MQSTDMVWIYLEGSSPLWHHHLHSYLNYLECRSRIGTMCLYPCSLLTSFLLHLILWNINLFPYPEHYLLFLRAFKLLLIFQVRFSHSVAHVVGFDSEYQHLYYSHSYSVVDHSNNFNQFLIHSPHSHYSLLVHNLDFHCELLKLLII